MTQILTGLAIHEHATIDLPADIGRTMLGIMSYIPSAGLEYGIYLKGTWDAATATVRVMPGEVFFPKQIVTGASIVFLEEPPAPEWNVVAHRHPHGCTAFSSTDKNSINEEFLASLLFIPPWNFPDAVVNIPLAPGSKMQVKARVVPSGDLIELSPELAERVRTQLSTPPRSQQVQKVSSQSIIQGSLTLSPSVNAINGVPTNGSAIPLPSRNILNRVRPVLRGNVRKEPHLHGLHPDDIADALDAINTGTDDTRHEDMDDGYDYYREI